MWRIILLTNFYQTAGQQTLTTTSSYSPWIQKIKIIFHEVFQSFYLLKINFIILHLLLFFDLGLFSFQLVLKDLSC